jgi:hypothetical protein
VEAGPADGSDAASSALLGDGSTVEGGPSGQAQPDPTTCEEAAASHSYVGCDYWPTVTANMVWSIFDFAAVVANAGTNTASVTVTGPGDTNQTATVGPGQLSVVYLPWVTALKGPDNECGAPVPMPQSVLAPAAAYHLVSTAPVIVYQFNALEYAGQGGPPGKDWSQCPGSTTCQEDCYSFSNDASLLLPSTAMTGNYRVTGHGGWLAGGLGAYAAITATRDGTDVTIKVSGTGQIVAGTGIAATGAGGTLTLSMNAGDVAELVGSPADTSDLSGSLVTANLPVQIITGMPCLDVPDEAGYCDHIEESNFPVETLGKDYVVALPTAPLGNPIGHEVHIYGNFDGTNLTYDPMVGNCPAVIDAGQVVDCGVVWQDFEVKGDHPFAVSMFTQGSTIVDPSTPQPGQEGDPDQSQAVAVEQFRTRYVFLAPNDYTHNYVVAVAPQGTSLDLDGSPLGGTVTATVGNFEIWRASLGAGQAGAHVLAASNPVGVQVMGYGAYTSYQVPGGLDLAQIAPPPAL